MADMIWTNNPPTEPGFYWVIWPSGDREVAEFAQDRWWYATGSCRNPSLLRFGPRIPSAEELAARKDGD